jgi:hypothetical protein
LAYSRRNRTPRIVSPSKNWESTAGSRKLGDPACFALERDGGVLGFRIALRDRKETELRHSATRLFFVADGNAGAHRHSVTPYSTTKTLILSR